MKEIASFTIGSKAFFGEYQDYQSHDIDKIYVMDNWLIPNALMLNMRHDGQDNFFVKNASKDELISETLKYPNVPMKAGKYLVPEFAKFLNMTILDLQRLDGMFENMDDKHSYERLIYHYYLENGDFHLTDKHRDNAYKEYKSKR